MESNPDARMRDPSRIDLRTIDSDCMRCGYLLVGVADDQPCPECGLLAGRSRRLTDALWDARPSWLRKLTVGLWLVLLSVPLFFIAAAINDQLRRHHDLIKNIPFVLVCFVFAAGWHLLTVKEGYAPADIGDSSRRRWIRFLCLLPAFGTIFLLSADSWYWFSVFGTRRHDVLKLIGTFIIVAALLVLPILGFSQLRSLARRVRHAHLVEHCLIVGWGTSAVVVLASACFFIAARSGHTTWAHQSQSFIWVIMIGLIGIILFLLWAIYVWIGFAIVFRRARLEMKRRIHASDRSFEST